MPEQTSQYSTAKLAMWAALLLAVLALVGVFSGPLLSRMQSEQGTGEGSFSGDAVRRGEVSKPAFTAEVQEKLRNSDGFQVLISYTDTGFEPAVATLSRGQTVRFTNNSSRDLMIVQEEDAAVYASGACDTVAFESCDTIASRDFWEFTFEKTGEWSFKNAPTSHEGVILVR